MHIHFRIDDHLSVKVGDFGFSRDIYNIDYYRLERKTRLPVKWLPPESLFDNKYNEKTDVVCAPKVGRKKIGHKMISFLI